MRVLRKFKEVFGLVLRKFREILRCILIERYIMIKKVNFKYEWLYIYMVCVCVI